MPVPPAKDTGANHLDNPNCFSISFAYRPGRPKKKAMVTAQQQALARAGIQVNLQGYPSGRYYEQNDPAVNSLFEKAMASLR